MDQKNNAGALFKNTNKNAETHPDYQGSAIINGELKQISAWINTSAKGLKYMSLTFQEPRDKNEVKIEVKTEIMPPIVNNDLPF